MEELIEVQSMHEQREFIGNPDVVIKKGVWIEVLNFNPQDEKVDIIKRWEVEEVTEIEKNGNKEYKIVCKELDIDVDLKKKKEIVNKIIDKHHSKLKASFAKCLIDGVHSRSIPELKGMLYKLGESENGNQEDNK